ncbi:MAG: response regulator transcription factor [Streptococcaceae bacterium]|jgi:DNA-binding response OmpR family regulator|nr:response regulator transcription factor [Streptococcaceae bacterium]
MNKLLIIEDDQHINNMLSDLLTIEGFQVTSAFSGTEGLLWHKQQTFDLILLDLMLPGKTGNEVLSEIRQTSNIPIIVLTALDGKESIVDLLKNGANDYMIKPFNNAELLARIEVQLRNNSVNPTNETLKFKDLLLDSQSFSATINQKPLTLSKREFQILQCMMENPNKVFTKNNLYETVWGDEFFGDDNTINVHISKIRSKLAAINANNEYIQTVWGIGFKMQD